MALEEHIKTLSYDTEGGAIDACILVVSSTIAARTCKIAGANADDVLGATLFATDAAGRATAVAVGGIVRVKAGGTVGIGDKVKPDGSGCAVTSTDVGFGIAIKGGAVNEIIEVQMGYVGQPA